MKLTARQQIVAQAAVNVSVYVQSFDVDECINKDCAALILTALHTAEFDDLEEELSQLEVAAPSPSEFLSIEAAFATAS